MITLRALSLAAPQAPPGRRARPRSRWSVSRLLLVALRAPIIEASNCGEKGLYAALAKTNLGFIWIAFLTFGAWVPMTMEWRCVE